MYLKMKGYFGSKPKVYAQIQHRQKELVPCMLQVHFLAPSHTLAFLLVSRKHLLQ